MQAGRLDQDYDEAKLSSDLYRPGAARSDHVLQLHVIASERCLLLLEMKAPGFNGGFRC